MVPFTIQVTRGLLARRALAPEDDGDLAGCCGGHAGGRFDRLATVAGSARTSMAVHFLLVACGWETLLVLLLALLDLLLVRAEARAARKGLHKEIAVDRHSAD